MYAQLRIYTINRGEIDQFAKEFFEHGKPMQEAVGISILGTWINRSQNEFIWIRAAADKDDLTAKAAAFLEARKKSGVELGSQVAKVEVKEIEAAGVPVG